MQPVVAVMAGAACDGKNDYHDAYGGYMLCSWCSLSINCTHGGWLVQPVAILSSGFLCVSTAAVGLSGKASLQLAAPQQW